MGLYTETTVHVGRSEDTLQESRGPMDQTRVVRLGTRNYLLGHLMDSLKVVVVREFSRFIVLRLWSLIHFELIFGCDMKKLTLISLIETSCRHTPLVTVWT